VNKVVARFIDGSTIKGTTIDFNPTRDVFHVTEANTQFGATPIQVQTRQLKALFFVKDLVGDAARVKGTASGAPRPASGRKIRVVFVDGEVLLGTTAGYQSDRKGFFVEPDDPDSNEVRCYVLRDATKEITLL
jgi:hypothetical protein